ncbi:hypothetical protein [Pendulispora albinea]|uniref:Uncharacterized protein n=1 Tax=Pendulispora albinea TaxID=2741071 RepID=A0ABZ2LPA2_9BACT
MMRETKPHGAMARPPQPPRQKHELAAALFVVFAGSLALAMPLVREWAGEDRAHDLLHLRVEGASFGGLELEASCSASSSPALRCRVSLRSGLGP